MIFEMAKTFRQENSLSENSFMTVSEALLPYNLASNGAQSILLPFNKIIITIMKTTFVQ